MKTKIEVAANVIVILCGNISQGMPLRRTNRIPVRQARSGTRGRPPFGLRGTEGSMGETRHHKASGSRGALIEYAS